LWQSNRFHLHRPFLIANQQRNEIQVISLIAYYATSIISKFTLYTPVGGSWLNMAESVQRIIVPRALAAQHPKNAQEIIDWLEQTVAGWNKHPTPFCVERQAAPAPGACALT
jgi:hypothetical protein